MKKFTFIFASFTLLLSCQSKEIQKQLQDTKEKLAIYETNIPAAELAEIKSMVKDAREFIPTSNQIDQIKGDTLFDKEKAKSFYAMFDMLENVTTLSEFEASNLASVFYGVNTANLGLVKKDQLFEWSCGDPSDSFNFKCCVCKKICNAKPECKPRLLTTKYGGLVHCLNREMAVYICLKRNCSRGCY